mgnify:CR=1 FL=1
MKTDIEIARSVEMRKITDIAESIGIPEEKIDQYGRYIAKVSRQLVDEEKVKKSKLILVTAITATKAGIGKTTVSVGLALGLNKIGDFIVHNDDAVLAGKIKVLAHLVTVETVED